MKKLYIFIALFLTSGIAFAQSDADVLRFSRTLPLGTARSAAMSGAFGALGGDISTLNVNPAGIGVFRKSEVSMTFSPDFGNTKSGGQTAHDNSFQLGDIGFVISLYNPNFDWKGINFGINYTNMNNFNRHTTQAIPNAPNSFSQYLAQDINGLIAYVLNQNPTANLEDYFNDLQWMGIQSNYILSDNENKDNPYYEPAIIGANQTKIIKEDGYQGEYAFSFGTNYKDKLYLGITIGLQNIYYKMRSLYTETPDQDNPYELEYFNFEERLKTTGVGTNFKFGVIYRPIPELRLGATIHTPTYYSMTDTYDSGMLTKYKFPVNGVTEYPSSTSYKYDYDLKTPWKAILSVAGVIQQKAILSFDYEYVNYSSARLKNGIDGYDYYEPDGSGVNNLIKEYLRSTHNFRLGAEYRINSMVSVRGGYSFYASPYKDNKDLNKIQTLSCGFGLNFGQFYCDAAYVYKFSKDITRFYSYYDVDPEYDVLAEPIDNKYNNHIAKVSVGMKF